ncbi:MAG: hypothetical protein ABIG63_08780 [Chloroflexota bacterium]
MLNKIQAVTYQSDTGSVTVTPIGFYSREAMDVWQIRPGLFTGVCLFIADDTVVYQDPSLLPIFRITYKYTNHFLDGLRAIEEVIPVSDKSTAFFIYLLVLMRKKVSEKRRNTIAWDEAMISIFVATNQIYTTCPIDIQVQAKPMSQREIEHLIKRVNVDTDLSKLKMRPTDFAQLVLGIGPRVLSRDWFLTVTRLTAEYRKLMNKNDSDSQAWYWRVSSLSLSLSKYPTINISGVNLRLSKLDLAFLSAQYPHLWAISTISVPPAYVVKALCPGPIRNYQSTADTGPFKLPETKLPAIRALISTLIAEAEKGVFAPFGTFLFSLPSEVKEITTQPDEPWGLIIYVADGKIWFRITDTKQKTEPQGPILVWIPSVDKDNRQLNDGVIDVVGFVLAAIWHDLRVAGPDAFPRKRMSGNKHRRRKPSCQTETNTSSSGRYFPRQRVDQGYTLSGVREWGNPNDREKIRRRRHFVSGFIRRLLPGHRRGEAAYHAALQSSVILPDGYTWVSPHTRGGHSEDDEPQPTLIRGLASMMAIVDLKS